MPVLSNPRHERFAQELAKGKTADEAIKSLGSNIGEPVGFYVYVLIDPRSSDVFYVGKGKGSRMRAHYRQWRVGKERNSAKALRIAEIVGCGLRPVAAWVQDGLSEPDAYRAERHVMFSIGLDKLTNSLGAPMPEIDRVRLQAKEGLALIRPYCRMFRLSPPASDGWENLYWGVISHLHEIANDRKSPVSSDAHYEFWLSERRKKAA